MRRKVRNKCSWKKSSSTGERTNRSGFETATSNRVFTTPNIDRSGHNLSATDLLNKP